MNIYFLLCTSLEYLFKLYLTDVFNNLGEATTKKEISNKLMHCLGIYNIIGPEVLIKKKHQNVITVTRFPSRSRKLGSLIVLVI